MKTRYVAWDMDTLESIPALNYSSDDQGHDLELYTHSELIERNRKLECPVCKRQVYVSDNAAGDIYPSHHIYKGATCNGWNKKIGKLKQ